MYNFDNIAAAWRLYTNIVFEGNVSPIQYDETKKAFYAGAGAMFELLMKLTDLGEDKGADKIMEFTNELNAYALNILVKDNSKAH